MTLKKIDLPKGAVNIASVRDFWTFVSKDEQRIGRLFIDQRILFRRHSYTSTRCPYANGILRSWNDWIHTSQLTPSCLAFESDTDDQRKTQLDLSRRILSPRLACVKRTRIYGHFLFPDNTVGPRWRWSTRRIASRERAPSADWKLMRMRERTRSNCGRRYTSTSVAEAEGGETTHSQRRLGTTTCHYRRSVIVTRFPYVQPRREGCLASDRNATGRRSFQNRESRRIQEGLSFSYPLSTLVPLTPSLFKYIHRNINV